MGKSKTGLIKHTFFNNSIKNTDLSFKEKDFNLDKLRTEFFSLYQIFQSNKSHWLKDNFTVFYTYYLSNFLIFYYQQDYERADLQKIKKIRKEIIAFLGGELVAQERVLCTNFPDFMLEGLKANTQDYLSSFNSISKLGSHVGKINTNRSRFNYSRGLASHAIFYLQKSSISGFVQEINGVLGNKFSFNESINFFNESRETITNLGMLLFALRFIINLILMAKHIIQSANSETLSTKKVLNQEMAKRGFTMASDFAWASVSLLTTYNHHFHINSSVISPLILGFLTFDTFLLLGQWLFEAKKYKEQVQEYRAQQKETAVFERSVIQRQLDVLNDEWEAQCAYFTLNIIGANILATCFATSMLCTGPFALAGIALFSMLGNAFYNTSEEYKKYRKSEITLRRELCNGKILDDAHHHKLLKVLHEECKQNYTQFWSDLAFNVGGIAFIITAAAASWPVALGLTLIYGAYRIYDTYQKELKKNNQEETPHDIYRLINPQESQVSSYNSTETPKLM